MRKNIKEYSIDSNMKIVRTPTRAEGGITEKEKEEMSKISKKWIDIAFQTGRTNKVKLTKAIERLYEVSGVKKPRVVLVPSPLVMAQAYGLSAGIWYLRKNKELASASDSATDSATYSATYSETVSATDSATRSATVSATRSATDSATYSAIRSAIRSATDLATRSATDSAIDSATRSATLSDIAREFVDEQYIQFLISCVTYWDRSYQGGNMWVGFPSYAEAMRDVIGLTELDCWEKYQAWEDCAKLGGFRVMHEEFCLVSDFPDILKVNKDNLPHSTTGPSHRWSDGFEIYHLNGINFPKDLWEKVVSKKMPFDDILKIEDVDQRNQALLFVGDDEREKWLKFVKAEVVDERIKMTLKGNPVYYKLYKIPSSELFNQEIKAMWYTCPSTGLNNFSRVPDDMTSVAQAMAWKGSNDEFVLSEKSWEEAIPLLDEA